jgi:hypothetical protein
LTLQIIAVDLGGGQTTFSVKCVSGFADINAVYWGDGDATAGEGTLSGFIAKSDSSLNMNGSGEAWDGGLKLSSAGLGTASVNKTTFLTAGETYDVTGVNVDWNTLDTLGVRATSTSTAGGSIKGVDGDAVVMLAPKISIGDATVTEGVEGQADFTVNLDHAYLYDVTISYGTSNDTAGGSDYAGTSGTVTIPAGQTSATVSVAILDDATWEPTESFHVTLTAATADIPGPTDISLASDIVDGDGLGTILDNDVADAGPLAGPPPPDNHGPVAVDDTPACGVEGLVSATGNVLDNDTDEDGDTLTVTQVNGTDIVFDDDGIGHITLAQGTLDIEANGSFSYTYTGAGLPVGSEATDSFSYTISDGQGGTDEGTVDLCIDAAGGSHGYWKAHLTASEGFAADVGSTTFDDYFGLDSPGERTWTDNLVFSQDLTFAQAVNFGNGGGNSGDTTAPAIADASYQDLVREAASAVFNFDDDDSHDAFVTAYEFQRGIDFSDAGNDAAVLADLKAQVDATLSGDAGAYSVAALAGLLHLTHE